MKPSLQCLRALEVARQQAGALCAAILSPLRLTVDYGGLWRRNEMMNANHARVTALLSGLVLLAGLNGCRLVVGGGMAAGQDQHGHKFTRHFKKSLFRIAENQGFSVELVPSERGFSVGENQFDLIIHDRNDNDVVGADLKIVSWMVIHGHGGPAGSRITERGGGLYTVEKFALPMAGPWELRVEISAAGVTDRVAFPVNVGMGNAHMHRQTGVDRDTVDFSTRVGSDSGGVTASWRATSGGLGLNRFEKIELELRDRDGNPLTGARISVSGGMPEHGHGLPTRPLVTAETSPGVYLVEGLRFSMPGWWELVFHIEGGDLEDSVKFNLDIK